jgi:hypothetical protein
VTAPAVTGDDETPRLGRRDLHRPGQTESPNKDEGPKPWGKPKSQAPQLRRRRMPVVPCRSGNPKQIENPKLK